jgi:multidrug resistance efflux pump
MSKVLALLGLAALLAIGYFLVLRNDVTPVRSEGVVPVFVAAEGRVETLPGQEVQVGAELTGRIETVLVKEGDRVKKGQVIARLESQDIVAKLNEAEAQRSVEKAKLDEISAGARPEEIAQAAAAYRAASADLDLAQTNLDRYRRLSTEGVVPAAAFDETQRVYEVARNRLQEAAERKALIEKGPRAETIAAQRMSVERAEVAKQYLERLLEKTVVVAPISGTIIRKNLHDGEVVYTESPLPLVVIANTEQTRINAEVDETDSGKIFNGEILEIAQYVGVRQVVPNDPSRNLGVKVVQVKISLPPGSPLKLGMTAEVRIRPKGE